MKILIKRFEFGTNYTIGKLYVDDSYVGYTLEDRVREVPGVAVKEWKIKDETAIPRGTYSIIVDFSNHFQRELPHVLDVPGFEGIRIHPGNSDKDSSGCILVGSTWAGTDFIGNSRVTFEHLFDMIKAALKRDETVTVEVQ